jgi:crotonobetainyl-CoA:carnitine CoA-transferase CaiB-like acyl-CoA transferase
MTGYRVIDCSAGLSGRVLSCMLADYGADVIKIEPPSKTPVVPDRPSTRAVFDRGKRSVICDLRTPDGQQLVSRLLSRTDVFIEAWRPGKASELGLGFDSLHGTYPRLVYCSLSANGQEDQTRSAGGYEAIAQARVGLMGEQTGHREGPIAFGFDIANEAAAVLGLIGIASALFRVEETGQGDWVDTSLTDGVLAMLAMFWQEAENPTRVSNAKSIDPHVRVMQGAYLCRDDKYIGINTAAPGAHGRTMEILGLSDRIPAATSLPEMSDLLSDDEVAILAGELNDIWQQYPRDEWLDRLLAVDVCAMPILEPCEVFDLEQTDHNDMTCFVEDSVFGRMQQVSIPLKFSLSPSEIRRAAPSPGGDTREVMKDLGYSASEIDEYCNRECA